MVAPGGEAVCLVFTCSLSSEEDRAECSIQCNVCSDNGRVSARKFDHVNFIFPGIPWHIGATPRLHSMRSSVNTFQVPPVPEEWVPALRVATSRQPRARNANLVDVSVDGDCPVGDVDNSSKHCEAHASTSTDPNTLRGVQRVALNGSSPRHGVT